MRTHWKVTERVFPHHQLAAVIDLRQMSDYSQSYWLCDGLNDFPTMLLPLREGLLPSLILHWDLGLPIIGVEIMLLEIECPPSFGLFSLWVDDKISYCWLWGRVCWAAKYPPSFCFGINSCCVLGLTMIGVEIRLLEMKCPPSLCLFSLWVDDKIIYCWLWGRVC